MSGLVAAHRSEVHGGFPVVIGNGVESPVEQQLIDQHRVIPSSCVVKGRVPTIIGQAHVSSMLQCTA